MHHNKSMYVTNVEKEGPFLKIWGQTDKRSSLEVEEALLRASERFEEGKFRLKPNSLEVGVLCCSKYVDEKYYRARIASIALLADGMVEVNFLDYGNKDVVPVDNLRSLECFNPSFISLPPLSSPFILAEVVCIGGEWNDHIIDRIAKEIRYIEADYVVVAQAIRYYFIKVFVHEVDLALHLVRQNLMQNTSIQTQEAVLLAMIPRTPQVIAPPNQSLLQYKSFTLEPNSRHEVYVSYITDGPCHFSVQLKKYESALAQLMREINSISLKPLEELPIPGTVCLAKCLEDSHICRAVVTSEVDSQYKLFYVDFGNTELVPPENLYQMAFKYIIPKIMAIRLSLADIEKSTMTLEMQCAFKQFVDNRLLMMEVLPAAKKMALPKCRMWDPDTNTDVIEVLNRAAICAYPDPKVLHKGFTQSVKVSFVYSCNRFYVQLKSKEPELNQLMVDLQTYCNSNQTSYVQKAKVGQPCCALFSFDQQWYRSLITECEGNFAKVRYIDYGNEEDVPVDSLKVIEGEYLTVLRPQAIECCLNGYQNMAEDQERDSKLEELILEQEFTMKVIDKVSDKMLVDLMDSSNTIVTALLLEAIITQKKVQAEPVIDNKFDNRGRRQSPGENRRDDRVESRNNKSYYQHDDRRSPRPQVYKDRNEDNTPWRQSSRNRSDSNSTDKTESWRDDNRGFKNRKENDWNEQPNNDNFRKDRGFRGRNDNSNDNERPYRSSSNRYSEGNFKNNRKGFRNQNGERSGDSGDGFNRPTRNQNPERGFREDKFQTKHSRNDNDSWGNKNTKGDNSWNDNKEPKNDNDNWGDNNSKGGSWNDNNQGFKKKFDREPKEWGGDENNRGFKSRNKPENDWNNKNSARDEEWGEKKGYKDRNAGGDDWGNKGGGDRKFGDRNREYRDNDKGGFKKKPFRENSEMSSSGSEKSFGKGPRTSSRNDMRPPRKDRKFDNKSTDNSWNISTVPSVIDSAPNDATFKTIDVNGKQEKVTISWFHNPVSFFCQLVDSQEPFKVLMQDIQEAYKDRPSGTCVKGAPAIGLFPEDNVLYRAKIMEVIGNQFKIHYVDFGNVSLVDKVWPIENKFMEMPMQAIPCGLSGIEPLSDNWPNPDSFSKYFEKEYLDCNFLTCDENGRYWVALTSDNDDISQQLVNDALAKYSEPAVIDFEIALFVEKQFRAMLKTVNNLSDFTVLLQSGICLNCSMHNLASATELNEDVLKQHLDQILIVYADDLVEDRLEVTLYDSTGNKLNIISPDEGAFDTVDPLCPYLIVRSTIHGFVSHVNETSVVIQPTECSQNIENLIEQMYQYYEEQPPDNPLIPEEDVVYAAKSSDGNWYRGIVTAFDDDKATVQYLDYGNSEELPFSRLKELPSFFMEWDAMAVLVNVKVPTAELLEQEVTATVYYSEVGLEGEIQLAKSTDALLAPEIPTEPTRLETNENIAGVNQETVLSGNENESLSPNATAVVVSHIDSPCEFYVQLTDSLGSIDELQLQLQEKIEEMATMEKVEVGDLCAAAYSADQQWYRSQILDTNDDTTTVRFIDYGNTDVIDNKTTPIRNLPTELQSVEAYCTSCRLKIKPIEEQWSKSASERFEELAYAENVTVEFVDQTTNFVEIYSDGINIKDTLLLENLAVPDDASSEPIQEISETPLSESGQGTESAVTNEESASSGIENENLSPRGSAVVVSHIDSPSDFYIQLGDSLGAIDELQLKLQETVEEMAVLESASVGGLCAAPYSIDQQWYRSQILDADDDITTVRFIDYGNTDVIDNSTTQIKTLPPELLSLEEYATRCRLKIKPTEEDWTKVASDRFAQLTSVENIRVEFIDQDEKTNYIELYSNGENVKDILIGENLAILDDVVLEGKLTGFISHMNSPSEFWVQLESCCAELEWIAEQLSNASSFPDSEDLTPGSLCAAMFPDDEMWYRARILSNTVAGLEVLFLDYGNSCVCNNLKELPEHLVMAPPLAQKCSLQKPEGLLNWSAEAAQKFIELSADGQTIFTVKKLTTGETSIVELSVNGEDVSKKLLPNTDNGYVTDVESMESFSVSKGDVVSEEKYKLEKIPGASYNQESLEKFVEINNEGKTRFDVEYLSENTVRLYLNGSDIRNELKDLLSPILEEKSAEPVSVIATIEVIKEKKQDKDICTSKEPSETKTNTVESQNHEYESPDDKTKEIVENINSDVCSEEGTEMDKNVDRLDIDSVEKNTQDSTENVPDDITDLHEFRNEEPSEKLPLTKEIKDEENNESDKTEATNDVSEIKVIETTSETETNVTTHEGSDNRDVDCSKDAAIDSDAEKVTEEVPETDSSVKDYDSQIEDENITTSKFSVVPTIEIVDTDDNKLMRAADASEDFESTNASETTETVSNTAVAEISRNEELETREFDEAAPQIETSNSDDGFNADNNYSEQEFSDSIIKPAVSKIEVDENQISESKSSIVKEIADTVFLDQKTEPVELDNHNQQESSNDSTQIEESTIVTRVAEISEVDVSKEEATTVDSELVVEETTVDESVNLLERKLKDITDVAMPEDDVGAKKVSEVDVSLKAASTVDTELVDEENTVDESSTPTERELKDIITNIEIPEDDIGAKKVSEVDLSLKEATTVDTELVDEENSIKESNNLKEQELNDITSHIEIPEDDIIAKKVSEVDESLKEATTVDTELVDEENPIDESDNLKDRQLNYNITHVEISEDDVGVINVSESLKEAKTLDSEIDQRMAPSESSNSTQQQTDDRCTQIEVPQGDAYHNKVHISLKVTDIPDIGHKNADSLDNDSLKNVSDEGTTQIEKSNDDPAVEVSSTVHYNELEKPKNTFIHNDNLGQVVDRHTSLNEDNISEIDDSKITTKVDEEIEVNTMTQVGESVDIGCENEEKNKNANSNLKEELIAVESETGESKSESGNSAVLKCDNQVSEIKQSEETETDDKRETKESEDLNPENSKSESDNSADLKCDNQISEIIPSESEGPNPVPEETKLGISDREPDNLKSSEELCEAICLSEEQQVDCRSNNSETAGIEESTADSVKCDISQENSRKKTKSKKTASKLEFQEKISTTFSAPTVSKLKKPTTKNAPAKSVPKSQGKAAKKT